MKYQLRQSVNLSELHDWVIHKEPLMKIFKTRDTTIKKIQLKLVAAPENAYNLRTEHPYFEEPVVNTPQNIRIVP